MTFITLKSFSEIDFTTEVLSNNIQILKQKRQVKMQTKYV